MCIVVVLFRVNSRYPLIVAANRDEDRGRPASAPHRWVGEPELWAGRDERKGGTWLGVNSAGLIAAVTNRLDDAVGDGLPSRGLLCRGVLRQPSPRAAHAFWAETMAAHRYNPFNLLCASPLEGWVGSWRGDTRALSPGAHVLSNRGDLDDRALPSVARAFRRLDALDLTTPALDELLRGLAGLCADTTPPHPMCRVGGAHGTVSSSLIALEADGAVAAYWYADGPPSEYRYEPLPLTDG